MYTAQAAGMGSLASRERHTLACRSRYHRGRAPTSLEQKPCASRSSAPARHDTPSPWINASPWFVHGQVTLSACSSE